MDRIEVVAVDGPRLERLFEGVTVQGFALWFNVIHEGPDDRSPVMSVGGRYESRTGAQEILVGRVDDTWLDYIRGESTAAEPLAGWEAALPWVVMDGVWKEVSRTVVRPRESAPPAQPDQKGGV